jgi:hypothetical protein
MYARNSRVNGDQLTVAKKTPGRSTWSGLSLFLKQRVTHAFHKPPSPKAVLEACAYIPWCKPNTLASEKRISMPGDGGVTKAACRKWTAIRYTHNGTIDRSKTRYDASLVKSNNGDRLIYPIASGPQLSLRPLLDMERTGRRQCWRQILCRKGNHMPGLCSKESASRMGGHPYGSLPPSTFVI